MKVIGIRFRDGGKIYDFDPAGNEVALGDFVLIDSEDGNVDYAPVVYVEKEVKNGEFKKIIGVADQDAVEKIKKLKESDSGVLEESKPFIKVNNLEMELIDATVSFDEKKITYYFYANGRVDFRNLVKDLGNHFRKKIRLQQIGARDRAKLVGGIGICGKETCCKQFLNELPSINLDSAKNQELESVSLSKVTGCCGRLMCCLQYDEKTYGELAKGLPLKGTRVSKGVIIGRNILKRTVVARDKDGNRTEVKY